GRDFSYFSWSVDFNNSNRSNSEGEDVNFQNSTALIRYAVGREFSLFARAGQSSNSFASNSNSNNNGVFYTFGGQWQPSHRFRLEAGYGNNRFVTVEITPFNRLHWITTYSNNDIGLNTGDTWNTRLNYNTRRTVWSLSYNEQTLTTQQLLLELQTRTATLVFINPDTNQIQFQDIQFNTLLPTLVDDVFISKRAGLSVSFKTGKSNISADIFRIQRTFELSGVEEEVKGVSGSWNWSFVRRSNFSLRSSWQKSESDGINAFSDKRFNISARITRNILSRLNGSVEYRYVDQRSENDLNSYSENRITANLSLRF
ncbi:MAG: TIGR03016 family PEP-CTERM system-associated outer membrane protein, partial [Methylomarinum sp.]|nr:TIGR03016 family PEP-CTERM system-associated outer membrane protein [Methylomarinum sp.]